MPTSSSSLPSIATSLLLFLTLSTFSSSAHASPLPFPKGGGGSGGGSSSGGSKGGSSSYTSYSTYSSSGSGGSLTGIEKAGIVVGVIFGSVLLFLVAFVATNFAWCRKKAGEWWGRKPENEEGKEVEKGEREADDGAAVSGDRSGGQEHKDTETPVVAGGTGDEDSSQQSSVQYDPTPEYVPSEVTVYKEPPRYEASEPAPPPGTQIQISRPTQIGLRTNVRSRFLETW